MTTIKLMISFLLPYFHMVASITADTQQSCLESICGRHNGHLTIRFPFRLINIQPESCGYPGFNLFCDASNKTILHLPNSGNFSVQAIDYQRQQIVLSDPDDCLPRRLLSGLDFSHSPFLFKQEDYLFNNFSFYNCSEKNENYTSFERRDKLGCLSTVPNFAIIGKDPDYFASLFESWCEVINNIRIPSDTVDELSRLRPQLLLGWDKPSCGLCEGNVTRCAFKRDTTSTLETTCIAFDPPIVRELSKNARYAIGFSVGLGVPAVLVIAMMLYKKATRSRRRAADHNNGRTSVDTN
ncbi:putative RING-H2 finger protein ATL21A [Chenopodium quinoa]|uniref:RING-type E3 ubiquitin transferase n=1 Tax=Chenopodium quinoa TaxID=63459 RepID=A0A803L2N6_CHEQI|nr:putative RING-H2 finger protein ATL21A [Chenopodium quinoa]